MRVHYILRICVWPRVNERCLNERKVIGGIRDITLKLFLFLCLSLHSLQDKGCVMSRALSKHCDNNKFNC